MSANYEVTQPPFEDLVVLQRKVKGDNRGYLERLFCKEELAPFLKGKDILQINRTFTALKGTVRGLHFQFPPYSEIKIVTCLKGEVFDVVVDLRKDSPTFLKWHGEILSGTNHKTIVIPEGFAHGLQTLTDDCEMLYLHTAQYHQNAEGGFRPTDPGLAISWPVMIKEISQRDLNHPELTKEFKGL